MENSSFLYDIDTWKLILVLFLSMLVCIYAGRRVGTKRYPNGRPHDSSPTGTIMTGIFGLLGFLLAFTFGMSGSRFEDRRKNMIEEANAIGTAILRADMYPEPDRAEFRKDLKQYLEARIAYFVAPRDSVNIVRAEVRAIDVGKRIWKRAANLSLGGDQYRLSTAQMVPAINTMLDAGTTELMGDLSTVPDSIIWMLFFLAASSAFYLGYSSGGKEHLDWFVAVGFCLLIVLVVFITLDIDRPRRGLIRMTTAQQALLELRSMF